MLVLDFTGVKAITIPEGNVKKITSGGVVLWEKPISYINLAEPNDTNTTDWSLWINNSRMGSDGSYRANATSMVTNFIEIEVTGEKQTFYFYGMDIPENGFSPSVVGSGVQVEFFSTNTDASLKKGWVGGTSFSVFKNKWSIYVDYTVNSDGYVTSMSTGTVWETPTDFKGEYYFRLALPNTIDKSKIIITKNQPIE